ncbi:MAG: dTDP-4-dehydrorhamnose 3,5-epimerase [Maricaulaceae bacterium]
MKFNKTDIEGVFIITPTRYQDDRGFFCETFKAEVFNAETDTNLNFVQDNFSYSNQAGTVRGLHYQAPPFEQGKLVRCTRGKVVDVAVDVRPSSPTYGKQVRAVLSADNGHQIWVPPGFLHGFCTLENNSEVAYKVTNYYSKECDGNVLWNDPTLNIDWGIDEEKAILSDKDKNAPKLDAWVNPF